MKQAAQFYALRAKGLAPGAAAREVVREWEWRISENSVYQAARRHRRRVFHEASAAVDAAPTDDAAWAAVGVMEAVLDDLKKARAREPVDTRSPLQRMLDVIADVVSPPKA